MHSLYDKIYRDLKSKIEEGEFPYQSFIPSESQLIETYSCSHNTARRAISLLAGEGYVLPINGVGVKVIYIPRTRTLFGLGTIETFQEAAKRSGLDAKTKVIKFEKVICDGPMSEKSGFSLGKSLIHIDRVRIISGERQILDRNFFAADLVEGLTPEIAEKSIYDYCEDVLKMQVVTSQRRITSERVTRQDMQELDLSDYNFVTVVRNRAFNDSGDLFEYTESRHRPDGFSFFTVCKRGV